MVYEIEGKITNMEITSGTKKDGNTWQKTNFTIDGKKYGTFSESYTEDFNVGMEVKFKAEDVTLDTGAVVHNITRGSMIDINQKQINGNKFTSEDMKSAGQPKQLPETPQEEYLRRIAEALEKMVKTAERVNPVQLEIQSDNVEYIE